MPFINKLITVVKVYILITIGTAITALAINIFMVPYKIAPGGLSGLATVIYYLSGGRFMVGATMLIINVPLFLMGYKFIGRHFFLRTLYGTIVLSLIIDLTEPFTINMASKFIKNFKIGGGNPDILLYSIIGGFLTGIGLGIVMKMDATTGGSELAAKLLQKVFHMLSIGKLILIIDAAIILFAVITFNSILIGLYSLVSLFITIKVIDAIVEGVDFSRALLIISDNPKEISKMILENMDRGVTEFKARGGYTGNDKDVLLCVIQRSQVQELKELVSSVDPKAFMIIADVREVLGEGFVK